MTGDLKASASQSGNLVFVYLAPFVVDGKFHTISKTYIYINIVVIEYILCITTIFIYSCLTVSGMPTLTIYLSNELYDKVKNSPSKIVRAALEKYFKNGNNKPEKAEKPAKE